MTNIKNRLTRNLARLVCGVRGIRSMEGYKEQYRKISGLLEITSRSIISGSNNFGTTLWLLGFDKSEYPRRIESADMENFLYKECDEVMIRLEIFINCLLVSCLWLRSYLLL